MAFISSEDKLSAVAILFFNRLDVRQPTLGWFVHSRRVRSGSHFHTRARFLLRNLRLFQKLSGTFRVGSGESYGKKTVYTKCASVASRQVRYVPNLGQLSSYFVNLSMAFDRHRLKLSTLSLFFSGSIGYLPFTSRMHLFKLSFGSSFLVHEYISLKLRKPMYSLCFCDFLYLIPNLAMLCCFSSEYNGKMKFARAAGSFGYLVCKDQSTLRHGPTALASLPSHQLARVSAVSIGLLGYVLPQKKAKFKETCAGYYRRMGQKPRVRGVAKNPVDHPHGGRENTVLWPRTP